MNILKKKNQQNQTKGLEVMIFLGVENRRKLKKNILEKYLRVGIKIGLVGYNQGEKLYRLV